MRYTISLFTLVLLGFLAAAPAEAKTPTATKKTTAKSSSPKKTPVRKASSSSSKKKTSSKRKPTRVASRAPRQSAPTAERYMEIQQALVEKGFHVGPASGQWGPEWVTALKQFQQAQNLKVDGKLGSLSLIALGLGPRREPMAHLAGKPEGAP